MDLTKDKDYKCPVCGESMNFSESFCPNCSFEMHILPNDTPPTIREFEENRLRVAKKAYDQQINLTSINNKLVKINNKLADEKAKLAKEKKALQDRTVSIKELTAKNKNEISGLTVPASEVKKELDDAKKKITEMIDELNSLKKKELELQKSELANKEGEYKNATKPLAEERQEKKRDNQRTGQEIGKVTFNLDDQTEAIPLFSGLNRVSAPQWANISGDLFEIEGDKGIFRLRDLKGCICDRHGKQIPPQGATTRNNDVFMVGDMTIRFTLPEIDLDYLF